MDHTEETPLSFRGVSSEPSVEDPDSLKTQSVRRYAPYKKHFFLNKYRIKKVKITQQRREEK